MAMTDTPRLSKSMDNLADNSLDLKDKKSISRSLDNLSDDLSFDKTSLDLDAYFDDDNEEGGDDETANQGEFQNGADFDEDQAVLAGDETGFTKSSGYIAEYESGGTEPEYPDTDGTDTDVFESKSSSSKRDNIINSMLVLDGKERSVMHKNWNEVKIDKDIQASVDEFTKGFFEHYLDTACNDEKILLIKALHKDPLKSDITKWLGAKLQIERDGWLLKFKMALKEVEENRKSALKAAALTQNCSEQLKLLLECFNVRDNVLDSIPLRNSREAIQRSLELLVEICNALMEDRFQCMQQLNIDDEGGLVSEALQQHLKVQEDLHRRHMEEASQQTKQAESENLKLLKEVVRIKKILSQKQQDVENLRKQMADINDMISTKNVHTAHKSTLTDMTIEGPVDTAEVKKPKYSKHQRPSTETNPSTQKHTTGQRQRPATETQMSAQARESSIHISQEKLSQLKQRAKRLEDSLHDAIASMDKLRKTTGPVTNNNNRELPNDIEFSSLLLNHTCGQDNGTGKFSGLKKDWERASFEIKGGLPTTPVIKKPLNPHTTVPKLKLKNSSRSQERRSVSERITSREPFKEIELKKTVELSATLAQLKVFKPQVGKVSKCLRCQKLFRQIDNHKRACLYHPKSKERVEKYTGGGQLVKVVYLWTCCKQDMDAEGCTYGQHV